MSHHPPQVSGFTLAHLCSPRPRPPPSARPIDSGCAGPGSVQLGWHGNWAERNDRWFPTGRSDGGADSWRFASGAAGGFNGRQPVTVLYPFHFPIAPALTFLSFSFPSGRVENAPPRITIEQQRRMAGYREPMKKRIVYSKRRTSLRTDTNRTSRRP